MLGNEVQGKLASMPVAPRPWGVRERLMAQKQELEERLSCVNAALDALEGQPGVAQALEAVFKAL